MSDNEEDSHEGRGDGRNRAEDDRSTLWNRAIGLLFGRDPTPERGSRADDRAAWERAVDERERGVPSVEGTPETSRRPSTPPEYGGPRRESHRRGGQRQVRRDETAGRRERGGSGPAPERQVTRDRTEQSRASAVPGDPSRRHDRTAGTGPDEDDGDDGHRAERADAADRTPAGNVTLARRHQIGEWVPRGRMHRYTDVPERRSISRAHPEPRDGGEGYDEPLEVDPDQVITPENEEWECRRSSSDPSSEAWEATLKDERSDRRRHRRWKRQFVTVSRQGSDTSGRDESAGEREQDERERDDREDSSRVRLR